MTREQLLQFYNLEILKIILLPLSEVTSSTCTAGSVSDASLSLPAQLLSFLAGLLCLYGLHSSLSDGLEIISSHLLKITYLFPKTLKIQSPNSDVILSYTSGSLLLSPTNYLSVSQTHYVSSIQGPL